MALVMIVALFVALTPASYAVGNSGGTSVEVTCATDGAQEDRAVTEPDTTLTVKCSSGYQIEPAAGATNQEVCDDDQCNKKTQLATFCTGSSGAAVSGAQPGLKLTIKNLPSQQRIFFLRCKQSSGSGQPCVVKVTVGKPGAAGESGTAGVRTCAPANTNITLQIPEQGSSAQFACEDEFVLYPSDPKKVYSEDCKKREDLKDIIRTEAVVSDSKTVYTLRADKKPHKKKLCYLCANKTVGESQQGRPEDYCVVYVESSARTQFRLGFRGVAVMLPCVLAVLHFT